MASFSKVKLPDGSTHDVEDARVNTLLPGTALSSGTDLNDLTLGRYYCNTSAIAASLGHTPITGSGFVIDHLTTAGNAKQILYPISQTAAHIYSRSRTSSGWGSWYRFEGTPVT